ncbi:MAG TPA: hypothetical protein VF092_20600 [Longimicrobium sp.]
MPTCKSCRTKLPRGTIACPQCGTPQPHLKIKRPWVLLLFPITFGFVSGGLPKFLDAYYGAQKTAKADRAADAMRGVIQLEKSYYARHGEYSINVEDVLPAGFQMPDRGAYRLLLMRSMDGDGFCLDAMSGNDMNVETFSMNEEGRVFRETGCPRPPLPAGETPEAGALRVASGVYRHAVRWKARHPDRTFGSGERWMGELPADEVPDEYHIFIASFAVDYDPNRFCFVLKPDEAHPSLPVVAVTEKGELFHDDECRGTPFAQVDGAMVGHTR